MEDIKSKKKRSVSKTATGYYSPTEVTANDYDLNNQSEVLDHFKSTQDHYKNDQYPTFDSNENFKDLTQRTSVNI